MKPSPQIALITCLWAAALVAGGCGGSAQVGAPPAKADILLFAGQGTSPSDVDAVQRVLRDNHFSFSTADTPQLNIIGEDRLATFRLLIVPGGDFEVIGKNLSPAATSKIRRAIRGGMNYLGICAGAFFAGNSPYNGLDLTGGTRFNFYALEARGGRKSAVLISLASGATSEQYWEDGPELSGWGDVVARYPDGAPAIVEGRVERGWVILTGVHPEATQSWRRGMNFSTPAKDDNAYAATLIRAALGATELAHF
jgi:glutamine amidotransferase-like uncharacterized protein